MGVALTIASWKESALIDTHSPIHDRETARARLIAGGLEPGLIGTPQERCPQNAALFPGNCLIVHNWVVRAWATDPDRWELTPPTGASRGTPDAYRMTTAKAVEMLKRPARVMSGLRWNDGSRIT